ncbi:hypothetical protein AB08_4611 [Escherichia coli 5-366-08_S1_C1]|nr:hypothetical protein AB08_4611 [Escherichia coli 5-366-08_S1_C1]
MASFLYFRLSALINSSFSPEKEGMLPLAILFSTKICKWERIQYCK